MAAPTKDMTAITIVRVLVSRIMRVTRSNMRPVAGFFDRVGFLTRILISLLLASA